MVKIVGKYVIKWKKHTYLFRQAVTGKKFAVPDSGYSEGGDRVSVVTRNGFGP